MAEAVAEQAIAVNASTAAEMFQISLRTWTGLDAAGSVPAAVYIGKRKRWLLDELRA